MLLIEWIDRVDGFIISSHEIRIKEGGVSEDTYAEYAYESSASSTIRTLVNESSGSQACDPLDSFTKVLIVLDALDS